MGEGLATCTVTEDSSTSLRLRVESTCGGGAEREGHPQESKNAPGGDAGSVETFLDFRN